MSRFVDFWSNLEEQNARLRLAFYTTLLVAGIEGWGLVTLARVPTPVYVVPGATKSGLYRPNATWHEAARDFALSYALTVGNFTPESAPRSFALSQRYLAPPLLSDVRATLEAELERIRRTVSLPRSRRQTMCTRLSTNRGCACSFLDTPAFMPGASSFERNHSPMNSRLSWFQRRPPIPKACKWWRHSSARQS